MFFDVSIIDIPLQITMFCIIKYIGKLLLVFYIFPFANVKVFLEYDQHQLHQSQDDAAENNQDTENQLLLINPHCPIGIVRDYISSNLRIRENNVGNSSMGDIAAAVLNIHNCYRKIDLISHII